MLHAACSVQLQSAKFEIEVHKALGTTCPFILPLLDHEVKPGSRGQCDIYLVFPLLSGSLQGFLDARYASK